MKFTALFCGIITLLALAAQADVVYLKDGTSVEGKLRKTDDGWVVTTDKGATVTVSDDDVKSIQIKRADAPAASSEAAEGLASLRRVVNKMTDMQQIIDRYEKYIAVSANSPTIEDAKKDLQAWKDRRDKGLVKVGSQWVTPAERDKIRATAQQEALAALDLLRKDDQKAAMPILDKAIADDSDNATAEYLHGVITYNQGHMDQAQKAFESVNDSTPNSAAVLNNLAVIAWRERSYVPAMTLYDQAITATPQSKLILDNLAIVTLTLPEAMKTNPAVAKCLTDFQAQDTELQAAAATAGWARWGSIWVTTKQLDDYKAQQAKLKSQIDAINADGQKSLARMATIKTTTASNLQQIGQMQSAATTSNYALPAQYYTLIQENAKMATENVVLQRHVEDLKNQLNQLQKSGPIPPTEGLQKIYGIEGLAKSTPGPTPAAAGPTTTAPGPTPVPAPTPAPGPTPTTPPAH